MHLRDANANAKLKRKQKVKCNKTTEPEKKEKGKLEKKRNFKRIFHAGFNFICSAGFHP